MAENNKENEEQIFNEDELQDIMNEFESLEREFHEGEDEAPVASAEEVSAPVEEEGELNISAQESTPVAQHNDNVVPMAKAKTAKAPVQSKPAPTSVSGVSMSLELPIGEQVAQIGISPEYGFSFSMDGVELTIDEHNGCVMTLPGGMTFTIPVKSEQKAKKSA